MVRIVPFLALAGCSSSAFAPVYFIGVTGTDEVAIGSNTWLAGAEARAMIDVNDEHTCELSIDALVRFRDPTSGDVRYLRSGDIDWDVEQGGYCYVTRTGARASDWEVDGTAWLTIDDDRLKLTFDGTMDTFGADATVDTCIEGDCDLQDF